MNTAIPIYISAALLCTLCATLLYWRYSGLRRSDSFPLGLLSGFVSMSISLGYFVTWEKQGGADSVTIPMALGRGLLFLFAAPVFVKLYRALMGQYRHPEEAQPGLAGVRAWLSPGGVVLAGLIATAAWYGFVDWMWMRGFMVALAALLTPPLIHSLQARPAVPIPTAPETSQREEDLSPDRERVLGLLEAGRITGEECAELLNALAATRRTPRRARTVIRASRLTWLAAGLLALALILPWFAFNVGQDARMMMQQMQQMSSQLGQNLPMPPLANDFGGPTVYITGVEVAHGLGWVIVLLGLAVVILPTVTTERLDDFQRNLVTLVALGIGSALLLYTIVTGFSHAQMGLGVAVVGYSVLWIKNRHALIATLAPAGEAPMPVS